MIRSRSVLLLKSTKGNGSGDKYEDLLILNGFEVKQVKTLTFDFKNTEALKEKLRNSNDFIGLIFCSPRCVQAVNLALDVDRNIIRNWQAKHNFVVGEATHKEASEKLKLECKGKESGNLVNLVKVILESLTQFFFKTDNIRFLFPHGNLKTDNLNLELGKEGIEFERILVYNTITNPEIEKEIAEATCNFTSIPEYVVFFSPSGFRSSINYLRKVPINLDNIKIIAIGPVTELAIKEENCKIHGVTKQPTPEELLNLIVNN